MPLVCHTKFQFMSSPMPERLGLHYTAVGLSAQPLLVVHGHICRRQLQAASGAVPLTFGREEVLRTVSLSSLSPRSIYVIRFNIIMRIPWVPVPSKSGFEMPFAFREVWWQGFRSAAHCTGRGLWGCGASPEGIIASPGLVRRRW